MTKEQIQAKIASLEAVMPTYEALNRHPGKVEARKAELEHLKSLLEYES